MSRRSRQVCTLLGAIRLKRPYYHCRQCGRGHTPWDETLRLCERALSLAAQEVVTLCGTLTSFSEAAEKTLAKLCALRLSESTVERTTEDAGRQLASLRRKRQTLGPSRPWSWRRDAQRRTCAYVSLDATGVRQQGEKGAAAEGKMAYVAMLYNPKSNHDKNRAPPHQARYLAGFYPLDELGAQLRQQADEIGFGHAEQQIALSDGGAGLEEFFRVHFPRAVCILDFWHVKEHLVELSLAWFGGEETARQRWLDEQCHRLKHEGGQAVLVRLEAMDLEGRSAQAREAHREHCGYFRNHVHRMDYPTYRQNGWQIGSGPVEAACKSVVGQRLKQSGMRWGEDGADAVCHLRALWLSESNQWNRFWDSCFN